jgi:hypothetical protein
VARVALDPEGGCPCCGRACQGERDIALAYRYPPRSERDWARLHTRNMFVLCASCEQEQRGKDLETWLREAHTRSFVQ